MHASMQYVSYFFTVAHFLFLLMTCLYCICCIVCDMRRPTSNVSSVVHVPMLHMIVLHVIVTMVIHLHHDNNK